MTRAQKSAMWSSSMILAMPKQPEHSIDHSGGSNYTVLVAASNMIGESVLDFCFSNTLNSVKLHVIFVDKDMNEIKVVQCNRSLFMNSITSSRLLSKFVIYFT